MSIWLTGEVMWDRQEIRTPGQWVYMYGLYQGCHKRACEEVVTVHHTTRVERWVSRSFSIYGNLQPLTAIDCHGWQSSTRLANSPVKSPGSFAEGAPAPENGGAKGLTILLAPTSGTCWFDLVDTNSGLTPA